MGNVSATVIMPALLGLAGTLLGLWLGHWRWSSEMRMKKRAAYDARRHDAYLDLWNILENAHVAIRTDQPKPDEIRALEKQINAFRLRNAIFLDEADSVLSSKYFGSVVKFADTLAASGSRTMAEEFENTGTFSAADMRGFDDLLSASKVVDGLRGELIGRIKAVMLETSYAAKST